MAYLATATSPVHLKVHVIQSPPGPVSVSLRPIMIPRDPEISPEYVQTEEMLAYTSVHICGVGFPLDQHW